MDENRLDCVEVEGTSPVNSVKDIMEWRKNPSTKTEINKYFLVAYVNGMETAKRKCITCGEKVSSVNSGTSTMKRHWQKCQTNVNRTRKRTYGQHEISFPKIQTKRCAAKVMSNNLQNEFTKQVYEFASSLN